MLCRRPNTAITADRPKSSSERMICCTENSTVHGRGFICVGTAKPLSVVTPEQRFRLVGWPILKQGFFARNAIQFSMKFGNLALCHVPRLIIGLLSVLEYL